MSPSPTRSTTQDTGGAASGRGAPQEGRASPPTRMAASTCPSMGRQSREIDTTMAPAGYLIERTSTLPVSAEEAFTWHERPGAFERLTPPWERVEVLERTGGVRDGARTVLRMHIGPVPLRWVAVHRDYAPRPPLRGRAGGGSVFPLDPPAPFRAAGARRLALHRPDRVYPAIRHAGRRGRPVAGPSPDGADAGVPPRDDTGRPRRPRPVSERGSDAYRRHRGERPARLGAGSVPYHWRASRHPGDAATPAGKRDSLGSLLRRDRRPGLRRARRGGAPRGRERRRALDRGAEAADPGQPDRRNAAPGGDARGARAAAAGAGVRLRDRGLRQPRGRDPDRGCDADRTAERLLRDAGTRVGGGDRARSGGRNPGGDASLRHHPHSRGRRAGTDVDPVPPGRRRPAGERNAVGQLDLGGRRRRRGAPRALHPGSLGAGERGRAGARDQPSVRHDAGPSAAPPRPDPRPRPGAPAPLRRDGRYRAAWESARLRRRRLLAAGYSFRHPRLEAALRHVLGT